MVKQRDAALTMKSILGRQIGVSDYAIAMILLSLFTKVWKEAGRWSAGGKPVISTCSCNGWMVALRAIARDDGVDRDAVCGAADADERARRRRLGEREEKDVEGRESRGGGQVPGDIE